MNLKVRFYVWLFLYYVEKLKMEDVNKLSNQGKESDKKEIPKLNTDICNEDTELTNLETPKFQYNNRGKFHKRKGMRPRRF